MLESALPGRVFGTPATALEDSGWAHNAEAVRNGVNGELNTAKILDALARQPGGPTVFHDLAIPRNGVKANIDHAIVSGNRIILVDSKSWAPGRYWTARGVTRRGFTPVPFADKLTLRLAAQAIGDHVRAVSGRTDVQVEALVVVWPSSSAIHHSVTFYRPASATAMTGPAFTSHARRQGRFSPASAELVRVLADLVHS